MFLRNAKGDSGSLPYNQNAGRFGDGDGDGEGADDGTDDAADDQGDEGEQTDPKLPKAKGDSIDFEALDPKVQAHIKALRKESAKYRTKARSSEDKYTNLATKLGQVVGGEDGDTKLSPEERAQAFEVQAGTQALETAILHQALEHDVPKEGLKYFRFLVAEALEELEEGEELDEDRMSELALEAQTKAGGKRSAKTSVTSADGDAGKGGKKAPGGGGEMTVGQFQKLSIGEKSAMFKENPDKYQKLFNEAKDKKLLI